MTDPSGEVVFMNPAAIDLYGFAERLETPGQRINLREHVRDTFDVHTLKGTPVKNENRPLVRALRGESYRDVELVVKRADDDHPHVYVYCGSRIEADPPLSVLTVRDETDRWRSERRYRVAFEADPAPSVIVRLGNMVIAGTRKLTTSIGVASFAPGDTTDSLFARADRALYAARDGGRNRVEVAEGA